MTEVARGKVLELLAAEGREGLALRLAIGGRGPGGFHYRLGFVGPEEKRPNDVVVDGSGFQFYVDPESAANLKGTLIDFVETETESGFKIDNPNPLWSDPRAMAVQKVLDEEINPTVGGHGGWVTLLGVKDDVAYVALGGGCQGCGMVDATLKHGIEARLREVVPGINKVVDTTDHAGGTNPYYRSSGNVGPSPHS